DPEWRSKYFHLALRPRTKDRQGGDGPPAGGSSVLDVAQGMGLRAVEKVRSARPAPSWLMAALYRDSGA
ncbi:MAG: hypothetical protein WBE31_06425, partial [Candidatus Sulfotelmatobacter sp.]